MKISMEEKLKQLLEAKVVSSTSGGAVGSIWKIEFEDTSYIFVHCSWRIEVNDKIVVTSNDDITPKTGRLTKGVRELEGKKISSFVLSKQNDLVLNFDYGYTIRFFCNIQHEDICNDYNSNWELFIPKDDKAIIVNNHFEIIIDKYY